MLHAACCMLPVAGLSLFRVKVCSTTAAAAAAAVVHLLQIFLQACRTGKVTALAEPQSAAVFVCQRSVENLKISSHN